MAEIPDEIIELHPEDQYVEAKVDRTKACWLLKYELKECIKASDCIRVQHRTPKDCMKTEDGSVPDACQKIKYTLFRCRRSQLDMRSRFRGRVGDV